MKLIKICCLVGLLFCGSAIYSQDNVLKSQGKIGLGIHGIDLSYELPLNSKLLLDSGLGAGGGAHVDANNDIKYTLDLSRPTPFVKTELKYYYNIEKRIKKGKNISNNAGNFVALQLKYSFGDSETISNKYLLADIHWGIQRSLSKNFLFNLNLGMGYLNDFDSKRGAVTPNVGLKFSYVLFR